MFPKGQTENKDRAGTQQEPRKPASEEPDSLPQQQTQFADIAQHARNNPELLTSHEVLQLQRTIGNRAFGRLLAQTAGHKPIPTGQTGHFVVQRTIKDFPLPDDEDMVDDDATDKVINNVLQAMHEQGLEIELYDDDSLRETIKDYLESSDENDLEDIMDYISEHKEEMLLEENLPEDQDESYDPRAEWSPFIPKDADQTQIVNNQPITLHNDAEGCLDDANGFIAAGFGIGKTVDIRNATRYKPGGVQANDLKETYRYHHFVAANELDGRAGKYPPDGFTWHHRKEVGLMQLIDEELHAAFFHKGGFAIWGSRGS